MPRGPAPQWRQRKPPVTDDYIRAAIAQAGGEHHPQTGHYGTLVIRGLDSRDEAAEYKRSLFRCALWLTRNGGPSVSISQADIERDGTGYKLTFRVSDKVHARKYQLETKGTDRSKWSYDPRFKGDPS